MPEVVANLRRLLDLAQETKYTGRLTIYVDFNQGGVSKVRQSIDCSNDMSDQATALIVEVMRKNLAQTTKDD